MTAERVFVRRDGPKTMLQTPYDGPYKVVSRDDKVFVVQVHGETKSITIDRLKPAYVLAEPDVDEEPAGCVTGRSRSIKAEEPQQSKRVPFLQGRQSEMNTRPRRKVRFPERFQAGL